MQEHTYIKASKNTLTSQATKSQATDYFGKENCHTAIKASSEMTLAQFTLKSCGEIEVILEEKPFEESGKQMMQLT